MRVIQGNVMYVFLDLTEKVEAVKLNDFFFNDYSLLISYAIMSNIFYLYYYKFNIVNMIPNPLFKLVKLNIILFTVTFIFLVSE